CRRVLAILNFHFNIHCSVLHEASFLGQIFRPVFVAMVFLPRSSVSLRFTNRAPLLELLRVLDSVATRDIRKIEAKRRRRRTKSAP
ncbi:hypothetical protein PFISCL1PPCAC_1130, partial [Pristionchus fissidentatus]